MQRTDAMTFAESGAPPWWLRALLWGAPLGIVAAGWVDRGTDGAAGGAVAAAVVLLFATLPLEFSFACTAVSGLSTGACTWDGGRCQSTRWICRR